MNRRRRASLAALLILAVLSAVTAACQAPAGPGAGETSSPAPTGEVPVSPSASPTSVDEGGMDDYGAEPGY